MSRLPTRTYLVYWAELSITPQIREGKLRSQGAFDVYIDAGEFGAVLVPLLAWLWSDKKSRVAALLGIDRGSHHDSRCNSSTPLLALAAALLGYVSGLSAARCDVFRWALVFALVGLHLVMKGPVWALIARIDLTGSSSGYHRYYLVDNFIRHFSDWWLLGYKDFGSLGMGHVGPVRPVCRGWLDRRADNIRHFPRNSLPQLWRAWQC